MVLKKIGPPTTNSIESPAPKIGEKFNFTTLSHILGTKKP